MTDKQMNYFESILRILKSLDEEAYNKILEAEKYDKALCIDVAKKIAGMMEFYTEDGKIIGYEFSTLGLKRLEKKVAQYREAGRELPKEYEVEIRARQIIATKNQGRAKALPFSVPIFSPRSPRFPKSTPEIGRMLGECQIATPRRSPQVFVPTIPSTPPMLAPAFVLASWYALTASSVAGPN